MDQRRVTQQHIKETQQRWDTLSRRIEALKRDLSLELEGQRRVVYQEQLADLEAQRTQLEAELHALEQAARGISIPLYTCARRNWPTWTISWSATLTGKVTTPH
jgi:hypothetical protein